MAQHTGHFHLFSTAANNQGNTHVYEEWSSPTPCSAWLSKQVFPEARPSHICRLHGLPYYPLQLTLRSLRYTEFAVSKVTSDPLIEIQCFLSVFNVTGLCYIDLFFLLTFILNWLTQLSLLALLFL